MQKGERGIWLFKGGKGRLGLKIPRLLSSESASELLLSTVQTCSWTRSRKMPQSQNRVNAPPRLSGLAGPYLSPSCYPSLGMPLVHIFPSGAEHTGSKCGVLLMLKCRCYMAHCSKSIWMHTWMYKNMCMSLVQRSVNILHRKSLFSFFSLEMFGSKKEDYLSLSLFKLRKAMVACSRSCKQYKDMLCKWKRSWFEA